MPGTDPAALPATPWTHRVRRSLSPAALARSVVLTVLALLAAPLAAGAALLALGLLAGQSLLTSPGGALAQVSTITVILFGTATLTLIVAMLAVAFVHTGSYAGRPALLRWAAAAALGALPRLLVALVAAVAVLLVTLVGWYAVTGALLVVAVVLEVRHLRTPAVGDRARTSPGVRRALLWAIPFLPVLAALAVLVALFPAALSRPASVRQLLALAAVRVRTQKSALLVLAVAIGSGSALLSWGGVALSARVQDGATDAGSWAFLGGTAVLGLAVLLLIVFAGAALAALSPAQPPVWPGVVPTPGSGSRVRSLLSLASPLMRRTAIVTVLALAATLLVPPAPTLAATGDDTSDVEEVPADALTADGVPVDTAPADAPPADGDAGVAAPGTAAPAEPAADAAAPEAAEPAAPTGPAASGRIAAAVAAPTELAAVLGQGASLGEDLLVNITISDPADSQQTVFPGTVEAYVGSTLLTSADAENLQWGLYVPTGAMQAGPSDLRIVYVPGAGVAYAGSETTLPVDLAKASTRFRVSAVPAAGSGPLVWGESHVVTAEISASADGDFMLDVVDTSRYPQTVIATVPVSIVNGEATVSVDLTGLFAIGQAYYMLKVVENDRYGPGGTEAPGQMVTAAPTTLTLDAGSQVPAGRSITVWATVAPPAGAPRTPTGTVKFTAPGYTLAPAPVYNGRAAVTFTPTGLGSIDLTATYQGDSVFLGSKADPTTFDVVSVYPSTPTFRWYGALTRDDAHVEIVFPASPGLATPTGLIKIVDQGNTVVGQGSLVDGVFDAPVKLREGTSTYRAQYPGDQWYQPYTVYLPDQTLEPYKPVVTLTTTDASPMEGDTFTLGVTVADVPLNLVKSVTVREITDGQTGVINLDANGSGSLNVTRTWSRLNTFTVTVSYLPEANLPDTVSDPVLVDVLDALLPDIRLSTTTPADQIHAGSPIDLVVTAHTLPGSTGTGLLSGSVVSIGDKKVVLHTSADGLTGTVRLTAPTKGGPFTLQGRTTYGPNSKVVQSPVLTLTVLAPSTLFTFTGGSQEIGVANNITVTATQPEGYTVEASAIDVEVQTVHTDTAGAVLSTETKPMRLFRSGTENRFVRSLPVWQDHAGTYRMTVTAADNGATVGAGSGVLDWQVLRAQPVVTVQMAGYAPWGTDHAVGAYVGMLSSSNRYPKPTGTVTYTADLTGASCTAPVGSTCTIPEARLGAGVNRIQAVYSGDVDYTSAFGSAAVVVSPQTIEVTATMSPAPDTWLDGQTVTASWDVARTGRPASGYMTAKIGDATCTGLALVGSCELTVPTSVRHSGPVYLSYAVYFTSSDDETVRGGFFGSTAPQTCVTATAAFSSLELISGTSCDQDGKAGFLTGSVVEVTAGALPDRYEYNQWVVNGQTRDSVLREDGTARYRLTLWSNTSIYYTTRYQPVCFTLTVTPTLIDDQHPGEVRSVTRPNCADPSVPTWEEWRDLRAGTPRYAAGTVVTVGADYSNTDKLRSNGKILPGLTLTGFTGAEALPGNPDVATVLMDQDRAVSAGFEVAACSSVGLHRGEGGSIAIVDSIRPENSAALSPVSGACTTGSGQAGFVPGTRITLQATADSNTVLESITSVIPADGSWCSTGIDCGRDSSVYDLHLVNTRPSNGEATRRVVLGGATIFGATFAEVRCVRVDTVTWSVASIVDDNKPVTDLGINLASSLGNPQGCAGRNTTTNDWKVGVNLQRTTSAWYMKTGTLSATTSRPTLTHVPTSTSTVRWASSAAGTAAGLTDGVALSGTGPTIDLAAVTGDSVTITATWLGTACKVPVTVSAGGSLRVEVRQKGSPLPAPSEERACREGTMGPLDKGFLFGDVLRYDPHLIPFFSVARNVALRGHLDPRLRESSDGRWYVQDWLEVPDMGALAGEDARLEFCAPLGITATITTEKGDNIAMAADTIDSVVSDNGGCPPGYAVAGATADLTLSSFGKYWYTLNPESSPLPTVVFDEQGNRTSDDVKLSFGVRCQTLTLTSKINVVTKANCPGARGNNRYLRGTAVEIEAGLGGRDELVGWTGAQTTHGTKAWVLMSEDRSVRMDYSTTSDLDFVGNVVSNFAQRLVGYLVTAVTGVVMAELLLVQGVMLAVRGAAAGLKALGMNGYVLNSIVYGLNAIESQLEMVSVLGDCLSAWGRGSATSLTDIPVDPLLAQGTDMAADQITDKLLKTMKTQLEQRGYETMGGMIGAVGQGRALTDAFATNLDSYTRSATQGWRNMSGEVGSCLVSRAKGAGWA